MIDYYRRLGLKGSEPDAVVRAAIGRVKDERLRRGATEILLQPGRKRAYEKQWRQLEYLGKLRASLSLNDAPFGSLREYAEYRYQAPASAVRSQDSSMQLKRGVGPILALLALGGSVGFILWEDSRSPSLQRPPTSIQQSPSTVPTTSPPALAPASVVLKEQPLPPTGWGIAPSGRNPENWIDVRTSGSQHTWLKVVRVTDQAVVSEQFIRAGERLRVHLPLGAYELRTATGMRWYGKDLLFGPDSLTDYFKADDTFPLNKRGEYWEVELILQSNGNLSQSTITKDQF